MESAVETVYGYLIVAFRRSHYDGEMDKSLRIDAAIRLLEEMWPDDCKRWNDRFKAEASS